MGELLRKTKRPLVFLVARSIPPDCSTTIMFLSLLARFCERPYEIHCLPLKPEGFNNLSIPRAADVVCVDWSSFFGFFELKPGDFDQRGEMSAEDRKFFFYFYEWLKRGMHKLGVLDYWCAGKWASILRFLHEKSGDDIWVEYSEFYAVYPENWAHERKLLTRAKLGSRMNTLARLIGPKLGDDDYAWKLSHEVLHLEMGLESPTNLEIQEAFNGFGVEVGSAGVWSEEFHEFLRHCVALLAAGKALRTDVRMFDLRDLYVRKQKLFKTAVVEARDLGDGIFEVKEPALQSFDRNFPEAPQIFDLFLELSSERRALAIVGNIPEEHSGDHLNFYVYSPEDDFALHDLLFETEIEFSRPKDERDPNWLTRVPVKDREAVISHVRNALRGLSKS